LGGKISDSVQEIFMAAVDSLVSMQIAVAWLLLRNNDLVRAGTRAAAQRLGALLR
jgi:hypothetical protein